MAICKYCELEMHDADGCVKMPIKTIDGEMEPIPYGSEKRCEPPQPGHRCHDCDALPGNYHHVGCDCEPEEGEPETKQCRTNTNP
jgi:hypothetical protein